MSANPVVRVPNELSTLYNRPLFKQLLSSPSLVRLHEVSFLGAIDYLLSPAPLEHHRTRLDHTIGVAAIAVLYAHTASLEELKRDELTAAALLHDVGHGPLSHTLEPFFEDKFGFDHHKIGHDIILGREPFDAKINNILFEFGLDPIRISLLIDGCLYDEAYNDAFAHPVNIDTIEAIDRSYNLINKEQAFPHMGDVLHAHFCTEKSAFDDFWHRKADVYKYLIDGPAGTSADTIALNYAIEHNLERQDFLLGEPEFFRKHPLLLEQLRTAPSVVSSWDEGNQGGCRRNKFWINHDAPMGVPERYSRTKQATKFTSKHQGPMNGMAKPECLMKKVH